MTLQFWVSLTAYLGSLILFFQLLLGVNFIVRLFTKDTVKVTKLHSILGIYGTLLIFVHPLLASMGSFSYLFRLLPVDEYDSFIVSGRLALIILIIIYLTSAVLRSKISYRIWQYIHLLSYASVFFVFRHSYIGTWMNSFPLPKIIWTVLFASYVGLLIYRLILGSGLQKKEYIITKKEIISDNILVIDLTPKDPSNKIIATYGQYLYLQQGYFGESHPFSIAQYNPGSGEITLVIRTTGRFTKKLASKNLLDTLLLDYPQGNFLQNASESGRNIIIAGGVGIAPFVEFVNHFPSNTILIHCVKSQSELIYQSKFQDLLKDNYLPLISDQKQLLDTLFLKKVINQLSTSSLSLDKYYICAGAKLSTAAKKMLLDLNIQPNQIFFEEFSL